jgi:hypothetical protein
MARMAAASVPVTLEPWGLGLLGGSGFGNVIAVKPVNSGDSSHSVAPSARSGWGSRSGHRPLPSVRWAVPRIVLPTYSWGGVVASAGGLMRARWASLKNFSWTRAPAARFAWSQALKSDQPASEYAKRSPFTLRVLSS